MTAAELIYGRRGGDWLPATPADTPPGTCWTCRRQPAVAEAVTSSDAWPVCTLCQAQGRRLRCSITYRPLTTYEDPAA